MRQISNVLTVMMIGVSVALWWPSKDPTPTLVQQAIAFPGGPILATIVDLFAQNPAIRLIASVALIWGAIGLRFQTATSNK